MIYVLIIIVTFTAWRFNKSSYAKRLLYRSNP